MATRATVTINNKHHFYHHWDGGLWKVGRDIAHLQKRRFKDVKNLIKSLKEKGPYEPTKHASNHTDREYHYEITLCKSGKIWVDVSNLDWKTNLWVLTDLPIRKAVAQELLRQRDYYKNNK